MLRLLCALTLSLFVADTLSADNVNISGGKTSVALDAQVLSALGLSISGTSGGVLPGDLPDSVGLQISSWRKTGESASDARRVSDR